MMMAGSEALSIKRGEGKFHVVVRLLTDPNDSVQRPRRLKLPQCQNM